MKKVLLSGIFALSLVVANAQPCVVTAKGNNGGGSCDPINGQPATGSVTLTLSAEATVAPTILQVQNEAGTDIINVEFGPGTLSANGKAATYCYYVGENNDNNLFGKGIKYTFIISYNGGPIIGACDGPDPVILPVSFKSIALARASQNVQVKWQTSYEQNSRGFYVQRLTNGEWQNVAFVFSQAPNGNSSTELSYSYTDMNTYNGVSQYRILQVDLDGKSKFSDIRSIRGLQQLSKVIVYPNPSNTGKINILFEAKTGSRNVTISDISGRMVKQFRNITADNLAVELNQSGVYSIQITDLSTSATTVEKVIIKKR